MHFIVSDSILSSRATEFMRNIPLPANDWNFTLDDDLVLFGLYNSLI